MLYFAYGSNMDRKQMRYRCPDSTFLFVACLKDYKIGFTKYSSGWDCGVADIIESKGDNVWGLVYNISKKDLISLDQYEGHPNYYRQKKVKIFRDDIAYDTLTYKVVEKEDFIKPSYNYIRILIETSEKYNFPNEYHKYLKTIQFGCNLNGY